MEDGRDRLLRRQLITILKRNVQLITVPCGGIHIRSEPGEIIMGQDNPKSER